jgi:hypothetical protein
LTDAALEAIEQAAGEAAKAAALAMLEKEAAALREAAYQQAEALRWRMQAEEYIKEIITAKKAGRKNTIIGTLIGIIGGLAFGIGGTIYLGSR